MISSSTDQTNLIEVITMSNVTQSQLETLPNELFLEIFRYTVTKDLRSFKGHNKRINSIIDDVEINLDFVNEKDADDFLNVFSPCST